MTDREEILVNRVGCLAHVIVAFIRKYPEKNDRSLMATKLNMSVKTVRVAVSNLVDLGVIHEEIIERKGWNWNKKFIVQPETDWKLQ